ncbi:MAG TPA: radical SAM/SPASM domain-containing protein [Bacteroidales bacterium]|nr:radical SAM/SPASM domain-containing protein [Bacteroidales bacterium]
MIFSKHNIFSKIKDSENYFIVNLLTGNADIVDSIDAEKINRVKNNQTVDDDFLKELSEKGYWVDEKEETKIYRSKYLDFIDSREDDEIQLFFVPNYSCNFTCSYCYQDEYAPAKGTVDNEIIDAFFRYIQSEFAGRKKYITVFGGEPLLNSPKQKELISYLIEKSNEAKLDVSFVTNGYTLVDYIDILKQGRVREVQITLDGTATIHNNRRFLKNGTGTFDKIVQGIDACISNHLTVNLRMVVDKENIDNLPELARFAIDKGWTTSPYFKTQIGRNYELHHCQSSPDKLFSRVSLYENLYELIKQHPYIVDFYKPAYSISKFLSENGSLPEPLFDSCPACKSEWAFDYTGHIYSCTATVGKADESLGTFFPQLSKKEDMINAWESRDVTTISECSSCSLQLACGGGCGSVAKNRTGNVCSSDCRPVKDLLELGFSSYFES